jgi:glycine/D-amino acid oxidase-like deaminating enzyme
VESANTLKETTLEIFPEIDDVSFTHSWSGKLGITFDLMPHIGCIDGAWYALGYGGHGVGIATYVGAEVGRLIAGIQDRSPFAEIPHPTRPYYRGKTWFLPLAARWYRFLDTIGR